ncbi:hypothetical protein IWQ62_004371, partial [Dispira parvispora]
LDPQLPFATAGHRFPCPSSPRHNEAAARTFQECTDPQGYPFVYLCSRRITKRDARFSLHNLRVNANRILDISFPAHNVVGLLVHVQFKDELVELLSNNKVTPISQFDPTDPRHLADPKYDDWNKEARSKEALRLQNERCNKALLTIREYVRYSVARSFAEQGWIDTSDVQQLAQRNKPTSATQAYQQPEDTMSKGNPQIDLADWTQ